MPAQLAALRFGVAPPGHYGEKYSSDNSLALPPLYFIDMPWRHQEHKRAARLFLNHQSNNRQGHILDAVSERNRYRADVCVDTAR